MKMSIFGMIRLLLATFSAALFFGPGASYAQTKLVMQSASPAPGLFNIFFYIADKAGFFKEEGLSVEIRYATGGPQATQIMVSGGADIAMVSEEPLLQAWDKGMRAKVFYQLSYSLIYFMAADRAGPLRTVADFRGRSIGVSNLGSGSLVFARSILRDAGVDTASVRFLPVGLGAGALAALKSGRVDALSLWDTAYAAMELRGASFRYFSHEDAKAMGFGAGYLATPNVLAAKRNALIGFSRAIAKATVFFETSPEASLRIYWLANPAGKIGTNDAEILKNGMDATAAVRKTFNVAARPDKRYGSIDVNALLKKGAVLFKDGFIKVLPKINEFTDLSLIDDANKFDSGKVQAKAKSWP